MYRCAVVQRASVVVVNGNPALWLPRGPLCCHVTRSCRRVKPHPSKPRQPRSTSTPRSHRHLHLLTLKNACPCCHPAAQELLCPCTQVSEKQLGSAPGPDSKHRHVCVAAQTQFRQHSGAESACNHFRHLSVQMVAASRRGHRSAPLSHSSSSSSLRAFLACYGWQLALLAFFGLITCCLLLQPRFVRHTSTIKMGVTKVRPMDLFPAPGACRLQPACQHRPHPIDRHRRLLVLPLRLLRRIPRHPVSDERRTHRSWSCCVQGLSCAGWSFLCVPHPDWLPVLYACCRRWQDLPPEGPEGEGALHR